MRSAETSHRSAWRSRRRGLVVGGAAAGVGALPALLADRAGRGHAVPPLPTGGAGRGRGRRGGGLASPPGRQRRGRCEPIGLLTYLLLKRLDDLAYGLGLWYGCGAGAQRRRRSSRRSGPSTALTTAVSHSDVLIVGAGSAGSVVAERLSADPACAVTVVEAGPGPSRSRTCWRRPPTDCSCRSARPARWCRVSDAAHRRARRASAHRARSDGRRIGCGQRRLLLPRPAPRLRSLGICRAGRGRTCCRTSAPSRPTWTSTARSRRPRPDPGSAHSRNRPAATAAFVSRRSSAGYRLDRRPQRLRRPASRFRDGRGTAEHRRRCADRARARRILMPALSRSNLTLLAQTRVARLRIAGGRAVGVDARRPARPRQP